MMQAKVSLLLIVLAFILFQCDSLRLVVKMGVTTVKSDTEGKKPFPIPSKYERINSLIRQMESMAPNQLGSINNLGKKTAAAAITEEKENSGYTSLSAQESFEDPKTRPLLNDVKLLTDILGSIVKREDPEVFELYEKFKKLALDRAGQVGKAPI